MVELVLTLLLPLLAIISIVFLFVSFKANQVVSAQIENQKSIDANFSYTHSIVTDVKNEVVGMHGQIGQNLIPTVNLMYEQLSKTANKLNPDTLLEHIKDKVASNADFVAENKSIIFFGILDEKSNKKLSFFISIPQDSQKIQVSSFSCWVENPSSDFMLSLLKLNYDKMVGKYGIKSFDQKQLIMLEHTILCPEGYVDYDELTIVISILNKGYSDLWDKIDSFKQVGNEILVKEYIALMIEENKPNSAESLVAPGETKKISD